MARDPGGRRNAHTLDAQARDLVACPTSAAKAAVRCPRVRADRSRAGRAAIPPASAPLRRKRAVAHDGEAQFSTVVTPALGAGHPVDRVHRSRVPGGNPRFSPKISEVKATDQQRPAQAPLTGRGSHPLDDTQGFMTYSSIPLDRPAWPHHATTPPAVGLHCSSCSRCHRPLQQAADCLHIHVRGEPEPTSVPEQVRHRR